jgi:hypothetical protein
MKPCSTYDLQGHALPKGGVAEDVLQMGGDFIVARDGRCEFICVCVCVCVCWGGGRGGRGGGGFERDVFAAQASLGFREQNVS